MVSKIRFQKIFTSWMFLILEYIKSFKMSTYLIFTAPVPSSLHEKISK